MKTNLTQYDEDGWYECRFIRNQPGLRVVRWWSGITLYFDKNERDSCDDREYTDFVQLVPAE